MLNISEIYWALSNDVKNNLYFINCTIRVHLRLSRCLRWMRWNTPRRTYLCCEIAENLTLCVQWEFFFPCSIGSLKIQANEDWASSVPTDNNILYQSITRLIIFIELGMLGCNECLKLTLRQRNSDLWHRVMHRIEK